MTKTGRQGGWRRQARRLALLLGGLYMVYGLLGCALQRSFTWPGQYLPYAKEPLPEGAEPWWLEIEGGERVEAWFFPHPDASTDAARPTVVYFHGNATLIDYCEPVRLNYQAMGFNVLLPEFRGYGRSGGSPSQAAIGKDMEAFLELLLARPEVDAERLLFHGRSVGCAVALDLSLKQAPAAAILNSPFESVRAMLAKFGLPGFIAVDEFDNVAALQASSFPALVTHGREDQTIPPSQGQALSQVRGGIDFVLHPGPHNVESPEQWQAIVEAERAFIERLGWIAAED